MSKRITRLEDARAMKAMGAPLNTEVIDSGKLPKRCERLFNDTSKAATRCKEAVRDYLANQNASTYAKLLRAHDKLGREITKTLDSPDDDKQLAEEKEISRAFVARYFTAYQHWADIIAALESGEAVNLTIHSDDDAWPTETKRAE